MKEIIEEKGVSESFVAKETGIPKSTLNDAVRKGQAPRLFPWETKKLCEILGLTLDELVAMYEDQKKDRRKIRGDRP